MRKIHFENNKNVVSKTIREKRLNEPFAKLCLPISQAALIPESNPEASASGFFI